MTQNDSLLWFVWEVQVQAIRSFELFICYYGLGEYLQRQNKCHSHGVYNAFYFVVAVIPYWLRFLQVITQIQSLFLVTAFTNSVTSESITQMYIIFSVHTQVMRRKIFSTRIQCSEIHVDNHCSHHKNRVWTEKGTKLDDFGSSKLRCCYGYEHVLGHCYRLGTPP